MSHEPIRPEDGRGSAELDEQMTATSRHPPDDSTSPLVSICIPTFNAARWILDCLESAMAQSYRRLELLIIDDASTDETVELIRSIDDERIRLLVNEQNIGLARNWNKCIEMSRGDFIKFLFHDDILYPDCVEKMMRLLLSNGNVGLVFSPRMSWTFTSLALVVYTVLVVPTGLDGAGDLKVLVVRLVTLAAMGGLGSLYWRIVRRESRSLMLHEANSEAALAWQPASAG